MMEVGYEAILVIIIRLVAPLLILRLPLLGTLLAAYIDAADYDYIGQYEWYQPVDKILDTYYLAFAAYTVFSWKDRLARGIAVGAFAVRLVGLILLLLLGVQEVLFFFPNFFEHFFVFYLLFVRLNSSTYLFTSKIKSAVIIALILIPKVTQEYVLHIHWPDIGRTPEFIADILNQSTSIPILLLHVPAAILLIWLIISERKRRYGTLIPIPGRNNS